MNNKELYEEAGNPDIVTEPSTSLDQICSPHKEEYQKKQMVVSSKTADKISQAIEFIDNNYTTKINLSLAASKARMSKFHFSRIFKRERGINYQDYLNKRRIEKAKELLSTNRFSVSETAIAVGYRDITHFERIFKAVVGMTPSLYKKTIKSCNY